MLHASGWSARYACSCLCKRVSLTATTLLPLHASGPDGLPRAPSRTRIASALGMLQEVVLGEAAPGTPGARSPSFGVVVSEGV
jgi:hypothetical protein